MRAMPSIVARKMRKLDRRQREELIAALDSQPVVVDGHTTTLKVWLALHPSTHIAGIANRGARAAGADGETLLDIIRGSKTARARKTGSVPIRALHKAGMLPQAGRIFDFGSGRGGDVRFLRALGYQVDHWDPVHHPDPAPPFDGSYDVVLNTYVLNVLPVGWERRIQRDLLRLLKPGGIAFITVRGDVKVDGLTRTGTYQRDVRLRLPLWKERKGSWRTYILRRAASAPDHRLPRSPRRHDSQIGHIP